MEADDNLRQAFAAAGKKYSFDTVEAQFVAFKDFKVRWQRSYKWADFQVSDYLADAPQPVLMGLAESLFRRIIGESENGYSEELCKWVTDPQFCELKQPIYLRRSRNLTRSAAGENKSLQAAYDRLIGTGLVQSDPTLRLSWTKDANIRKVGRCSVLLRVVSISRVLDADEIPDFVLDYCLYHELCHLILGFDPTGARHGQEFAGMEAKFPQQKEAEQWLRRLCLYL